MEEQRFLDKHNIKSHVFVADQYLTQTALDAQYLEPTIIRFGVSDDETRRFSVYRIHHGKLLNFYHLDTQQDDPGRDDWMRCHDIHTSFALDIRPVWTGKSLYRWEWIAWLNFDGKKRTGFAMFKNQAIENALDAIKAAGLKVEHLMGCQQPKYVFEFGESNLVTSCVSEIHRAFVHSIDTKDALDLLEIAEQWIGKGRAAMRQRPSYSDSTCRIIELLKAKE